jgi:hypothetical protein
MGYLSLFIRRINFHSPFRISEFLYASSIPLDLQCKVLDNSCLRFRFGTWWVAFHMMLNDIDDNGSIPTLREWRIGWALDCDFITNLRGIRKCITTWQMLGTEIATLMKEERQNSCHTHRWQTLVFSGTPIVFFFTRDILLLDGEGCTRTTGWRPRLSLRGQCFR